MINRRCIGIVHFLLRRTKPIPIAKLAEFCSVSDRTIRNDMEIIDEWLLSNDLNPIRRVPNLGVQLIELGHEIIDLLRDYSIEGCFLLPKERILAIVGQILFREGPITTIKISQIFKISTATVTNDMRDIKAWMEENQVNLVSRPRIGTYVEDSEENIRRGCFILLKNIMISFDYMYPIMIHSHFADLKGLLTTYRLDKLAYIFEMYREKIWSIIQLLQSKNSTNLTDEGICDLFFHLLIVVTRIKQGHSIKVSFKNNSFFMEIYAQQNIDFSEVVKLIDIDSINEDEQRYLNLVWYSLDKYSSVIKEDSIEMKMAKEFIASMEIYLGRSINVDMRSLVDIATYINIFTCRQFLKIYSHRENQVEKESIFLKYPNVYKAVYKWLHDISINRLNIEPCCFEQEASDVAFILVSSISDGKLEEVSRIINVIIVCNSGLATSRFLEYRLKSLFNNINVTNIISYNEFLETEHELQGDIIISTIPLQNSYNKYIYVNPMLPIEDIVKLMSSLPFQLQLDYDCKSINKTIDIVINALDIKPQQKLMLIVDVAKRLQEQPYLGEKDVILGIKHVLRPGLVRIGVDVQNCDEAIQAAGDLLINKGYITQKHVNEMIYFNKKYKGYSVIDDDVAMPHLLTQDISGPCMSIITLKKPIPMRLDSSRTVSLIIMLLTNDNTSHLNIIAEIIELLNIPQKKQKLITAKSTEDIFAIIN